MSVTDLEIEEAIREAWTILYAGVPPSARLQAAALLAVTGGTQAHPHWVTPDDLWRDRLAVLAEQNAWLAAWGPRPGELDCRVPPALLPESQSWVLPAGLLVMTGGTPAHPHWVTPDDLWRDRLAVLAEQNAWLRSSDRASRTAECPLQRWGDATAATGPVIVVEARFPSTKVFDTGGESDGDRLGSSIIQRPIPRTVGQGASRHR